MIFIEVDNVCGRFSFSYEDFSEVIRFFNIRYVAESYPQRWNIAPSQPIPAIISDGRVRRFGTLKWGLLPSLWRGSGPKPINTRTDTLQKNPVFVDLLRRKRTIIPATGWYEWHRNTKQPHNIRLKSRHVIAFAGLYDTCLLDSGEVVHTASIVTGPAPFSMSVLHDRAPVILESDDVDVWLDRRVNDFERLMALLKPLDETRFEWYPVDTMVGDYRNDVEGCVQGVE